jgi:tetratricopeptide (TPR) repeat protein
LALVLVIATVAAYQPVWHAGFIWDDEGHVTENPNLRSVHGLYRIWFEPSIDQQYYPLQLTSYWIEYHLWGLRPFGYHAVNVLLHTLNALLLWMVLQQLKVPCAWLAAAVFALHPVQVESVAWVSELKNLLSMTFYLGSLLAFFRFRPMSGKAQAGSPPWRFYWLAIALFLCALLSKTVACSLPAVLVLLLWWKAGRVERRDIEVLSPMFLLGIILGLMTAWLEKHHVGASGAEWSLSFLQRCLLAGRVSWFYVGKLCWPHPLIFIYPHWEVDPAAWWQYLFPAAALAVLLALWSLRSRIGRGPLAAALCFGCALFPALGFFDVFPFRFSFVADHFQYLASAGLIAVVAGGGAMVCDRAGPRGRQIGAVAVPVALLSLGTLTWRQAHIYHDVETLWRDTLAKNPQCWMAHGNLGVTLASLGHGQEAMEHWEQMLRISPDFAEAHNNLGVALMRQGKFQEAIGHYEQALRIKPNYVDVHCNLGAALVRLGRVQEAIGHCEWALQLRPDFAEGHKVLGDALLRAGNVREAIGHYKQALQIKPDFAEAHNGLGHALFRAGKVSEAISHYEQALQIQPDYAEAHHNLAIALVQQGRPQEAISHWEQAVRIKPDFTEAYFNSAVTLERLGRTQEAIQHYQQALRLKPDFTEAQNALARLQAGQ